MNEPNSSAQAPPTMWRIVVLGAAVMALALFSLLQIWQLGRPIDLPNVADERFECASYTPSHNGRMLDAQKRRELIAADLKLLAKHFGCVRTYSVSEGLDAVPPVARELGLKVLMGMWISMDAPSNDREIDRGVALANEYRDVVMAVIVGNEVLLRREQSPQQLRALLERVRSKTKVPVTYADVWEFWLRNSDLAEVADFVTIHILPYWEDNPIDIDRAVDHVQSIYKKVQVAFPSKRVVIGETGWPSVGRPRLNAVPSVINEARFIREFAAHAKRENIPYNLIEAFDQPWKRNQEGTVGGYWGIFDAHGGAKFTFTGPTLADPQWRKLALVSLIGVVLFAVIARLLKPRVSFQALALLAIVGHAGGSIAVLQWLYFSTANRSTLEWIVTSIWVLSGWCLATAGFIGVARWVDGRSTSRPIGISEFLHGLGYGAAGTHTLERVLGMSLILFLLGLAYVNLGLTYDGRGRDFPIASIVLPCIAMVILEIVAPKKPKPSNDSEELLIALLLIVTSVVIAVKETILNSRAMAWCVLCGLLGATILVGHWRSLYPDQQAKQNSDSAKLEPV